MKPLQLIEMLEEQGLTPYPYSGRFMYGAHCVGVDVDNPGGYQLPVGWKMDNMGMGYVIYWPDSAWPEGRKDQRR
jgi:hypothetical protein